MSPECGWGGVGVRALRLRLVPPQCGGALVRWRASGEVPAPSHAPSANQPTPTSSSTERLDRLKALRWRHPALPDRVRDGLSASEREFCAAYDRLVSDYCSSSRGIGLDLAAAGAPPRGPGDAFVLVARPGLGDVAFSTGTFTLALGTTHALPRDEAGPLIREGALVEVAEGAAEAQHLPTCLA